MAPDAVQTKHSVAENATVPPALLTHAAIAGPAMPSRSPSTTICLPSNMGSACLLSGLRKVLVQPVVELCGADRRRGQPRELLAVPHQQERRQPVHLELDADPP